MSVARSSLLFSIGTLLSRITGLVRDRLVLAVFGASGVLDGFVVAFRLPNMLREMLAEGSLGQAFTKVYSSVGASDARRARTLLIEALLFLALAAAAVCALGILLAPWLVHMMTFLTPTTPGGETIVETATGLTRLLFPFLGFMILASVTMGALHDRGRYFLTSVSPIAFNLGYIAGAVVLSDLMVAYGPEWIPEVFASKAVTGLAIGVLLGGLGQFLVQLFGILRELREGWAARPHGLRILWTPELKQVLLLMGPMVLAASAGQVNMVVNTIFATSLGEGAVVWLYAAFRLLHLPIGLFGVAVGVAVLPPLSRSLARTGGEIDENASLQAQNALELVVWLMIPCLVFYQWNGFSTLQLLFQSGEFNADDVLKSAYALKAYSWALLGYGLIKVLTAFYFAIDRTRYPMIVSTAGIFINLVANYLLVDRYGHVGLAYAYSVTLTFNAALLAYAMRGRGFSFDRPRAVKSLGVLLVAVALSSLGQWAVNTGLEQTGWRALGPVWAGAGLQVLINGVVTLVFFAGPGLWLSGLTPAQALGKLKRK